jgi:hypothetical protein
MPLPVIGEREGDLACYAVMNHTFAAGIRLTNLSYPKIAITVRGKQVLHRKIKTSIVSPASVAYNAGQSSHLEPFTLLAPRILRR